MPEESDSLGVFNGHRPLQAAFPLGPHVGSPVSRFPTRVRSKLSTGTSGVNLPSRSARPAKRAQLGDPRHAQWEFPHNERILVRNGKWDKAKIGGPTNNPNTCPDHLYTALTFKLLVEVRGWSPKWAPCSWWFPLKPPQKGHKMSESLLVSFFDPPQNGRKEPQSRRHTTWPHTPAASGASGEAPYCMRAEA